MKTNNDISTYDIISIAFLALTTVIFVFFIVRLMGPEVTSNEPTPVLPTLYVTPTPTFTYTPTITPRPSRTPIPTDTPIPSDTPTMSNTPSEVPTIAPTSTITDTPGPTLTPSDTPTPRESATFTPSFTPAGPTITNTPTTSPFIFEAQPITFGENTANSAGCAWQGAGGSVIALDGTEAIAIYQIHIVGEGVDRSITTASNSLYGATSGWEITLDTGVSPKTFHVRLETTYGTPLSDDYQFTFPGHCQANVAYIRFIQIGELGPPSQ